MILDELVAEAHRRVKRARAKTPLEALREQVAACPPPRDFLAALKASGVSLIAEIKRASPSRGMLNATLDPPAWACRYASAGADAISILTEPSRFQGSLEDLRAVRSALQQRGTPLPLLRKDFIVDGYQLFEARLYGADAVLLIAAALEDGPLSALYAEALALGLTPLLEVHSLEDLERVLPLRPSLIGINNRDLTTFQVDISTTARLREHIPPECVVVSESGIHHPDQVRWLASLGVDALLVGEALVTAEDPAATLRALKEAGR